MQYAPFSRRSFLKATGFAGVATAIPSIIPASVLGQAAPSKLIQIGVIGLGRIATTMDMPGVMKYPDKCRIVAVCDLDSKRLANGKTFVEERYNKRFKTDNYTVKTYSDYRVMLADPALDAVLICVPDHWHALCAAEAMLAGKHVWLQKPFAQTIQEGRIIAEIARIKNRVVQVGSWQRSVSQFHDVCELVRNGRLGAIKQIEVGIGLDRAGGSSAAEPVPENLNYDMWLGPTDPTAPYNWTRVHTQDLKRIGDRPGWIQLEPYGWGMITNWGAHHMDIVQWGLGKDTSGPDGVSGTCEWMDTTGGKLWNVHTTYDLHYRYGKTDVHVCNKFPMGIKFIGENGDWLYCMRGTAKVTPSDPDTPSTGKMKPLMASKNILLEKIADPKDPLMVSRDHFGNWLDAIIAGDPSKSVTNAEGGHRSTAACSLGHMCMKAGKAIKWDPVKETTGDPEVDKMMKPFERGEYSLAATLKKFGMDIDKVLARKA